MAQRRILVFDLDGTLVDSAPDLAAALNRLLAEHGAAPLALPVVRAMIGDGAGLLVSRGVTAAGLPALAAPEAFAATLARFLALYRDCLVEQTRAYPDVPDVLPELAEAGHRLGVCTNKPIEPTRRILAALDLARFFGAVLGGDSLPQRKPAPEPLLATIAALGDSAAGGGEVMIGDSANDMLCARAASVTGILIPSDYGNPAEDADLTLARFADLPAALARL